LQIEEHPLTLNSISEDGRQVWVYVANDYDSLVAQRLELKPYHLLNQSI
jgi:hypothetical protein